MKKYVVMIALGLVIAGTSQAQNVPQRNNNAKNPYSQNRSENKDNNQYQRNDNRKDQIAPEQQASQRTEMLSKKYGLNSKQKKQLQALNLKHAHEIQGPNNPYNQVGERSKKQQPEMQRTQANWDKEFKGIVSKKQYAKYESDKKGIPAQPGNRRG